MTTTYPGTGSYWACHGLGLYGDGGAYTTTSNVKSNISTQTWSGTSTYKTSPSVSLYVTSNPTQHITMTGTVTSKFTKIGTVTAGTRTYDLTFTNPDGSIFGVYKGSGTLSQPMVGSCSLPL